MSQFLQWHSIRGQPEIDMWKPLPPALSRTLTQVTFSSEVRLLEKWWTKIDRMSSHSPRIPHLLWQSSGDSQGETRQAQHWDSDRDLAGLRFPITVGPSEKKALRKPLESALSSTHSWDLRLGRVGDYGLLHLLCPGAAGCWLLLKVAAKPFRAIPATWWGSQRPLALSLRNNFYIILIIIAADNVCWDFRGSVENIYLFP